MDSQRDGQAGPGGGETSALSTGRQLGKSVAAQAHQIASAPKDAYLVARNKSHMALLKATCKALGRTDLNLLAIDTVNWSDLLRGKRGVHVVLAHTVWFRADDIPMLQDYKTSGVAVFMR